MSPESDFPFFLDEYGLDKFFLYYYSEPNQILNIDYHSLSIEVQLMVDYLDELYRS